MQLERGLIIHFFDDTTSPPKNKFMVIVGSCDDDLVLATVYVNSRLNTTVLDIDMQSLNIKIYANNYSFLTQDSYIDCSKI